VCGEADAITPPADQREMAAIAADAQLVIVAGHLTPVEAPRVVTAALIDWIEQR
jgi:pimeloyl-ACP methyl ester carboxylesterase